MAQIDKKQYLKKYLSSNAKNEKKKKRKKKQITGASFTIIDDDIDLSTINSLEDAANLMEANEDAPQVVGVIDDRPMHLRISDYQTNQWKPLGASENNDSNDTPSLEQSSTPKELISLKLKTSVKVKDYDQNPASRTSDSVKTSSDYSPPRRGRKDSDASPVRKSPARQRDNLDNSPSRQNTSPQNRRVDNDISPPRRRRQNSDSSPSRRKSPSYRSPSRRPEGGDDMSPPRRQRRDSDNSPPRKKQTYSNRHSSRSPSRRRREDLGSRSSSRRNSPPRRSRFTDSSPPRRSRSERKSPTQNETNPIPGQPDNSKRKLLPGNAKGKYLIPAKRTNDQRMTKTLEGKAAGLQNVKELVLENEMFRKREEEMFKNMPAEVSGVNATPVFRDHKTGKKRDLAKEAEEQKEKDKVEQENKEKYSRWGRGLKQVQDYEDKLEQDLHEMNKPLARYADDEDLEKYFKSRVREGDPSLAFMKNKNPMKPGTVLKATKSGFDFMPNRFGIAPAIKWDGVNRSNGYEVRWIQEQNEKLTSQEDSYKWSTEDM